LIAIIASYGKNKDELTVQSTQTIPVDALVTQEIALVENPTLEPSPTPLPTDTALPTKTPKNTNTPLPTKTPRPTSTPKAGTLENPLPYGVTSWYVESGGIRSEYTITVLENIRGADAWVAVSRANMFNDEPPQGMEYILIHIEIAHTGNDSGVVEIDEYDFGIETQNQLFDAFDTSVCCLEDVGYPELDVALLAGAKADGWIALPVFIEDNGPLLTIKFNMFDDTIYYLKMQP